jgi:hypothetical protein
VNKVEPILLKALMTMFLFTVRAIFAVFRFPIPTTKPEELKPAER